MTSRTTEQFRKLFADLPEDVQQQAQSKFSIWLENPHHPSLHFKKVSDNQPVWSVRVNRSYRALGMRAGDHVDPKGLNVGTGDIDADPKVRFCQNITDYEADLNERAGRDDVRLHAFIASTTPFQTLRDKQTLDTRAAFEERRVYFLEDGPTAVQAMLKRSLDRTIAEDEPGVSLS